MLAELHGSDDDIQPPPSERPCPRSVFRFLKEQEGKAYNETVDPNAKPGRKTRDKGIVVMTRLPQRSAARESKSFISSFPFVSLGGQPKGFSFQFSTSKNLSRLLSDQLRTSVRPSEAVGKSTLQPSTLSTPSPSATPSLDSIRCEQGPYAGWRQTPSCGSARLQRTENPRTTLAPVPLDRATPRPCNHPDH